MHRPLEYRDQNILVRFKEDEYEMIDAHKNGKPYFFAADITVYQNGDLFATYFRRFEKKVTPVYYQQFIKKFLSSPEYRDDFLISPLKWEGVINHENAKGVNDKCANRIHTLNRLEVVTMQELMTLKTWGLDKFSQMRERQLYGLLTPAQMATLMNEIKDAKIRLDACRWLGRGLREDLAIEKARQDAQIHFTANQENVST